MQTVDPGHQCPDHADPDGLRDERPAGKAVTLVGFGNADNGPYGIKRHVTTTINGIDANNEVSIGGNGKDTCQGDSGGPAFVPLADGTWRVFGITSYGGDCGTGGNYSMMHKGMAWFETTVGLDLTPCHNADGTWNPTAACGNFPKAPNVGGGTWAGGCSAGSPSGVLSSTCGAAYSGGQPPPPPPATPWWCPRTAAAAATTFTSRSPERRVSTWPRGQVRGAPSIAQHRQP